MGQINREVIERMTNKIVLDFISDYELPFDFCGSSLPEQIEIVQNRVMRGYTPICYMKSEIYKILEEFVCDTEN